MNILNESIINSNHEIQMMFTNLATLNYQYVLWLFVSVLGIAIVLEYLHLGTEVIQNVTPMSSKIFGVIIWIVILLATLITFLQAL